MTTPNRPTDPNTRVAALSRDQVIFVCPIQGASDVLDIGSPA
jgi:hypothetical protein